MSLRWLDSLTRVFEHNGHVLTVRPMNGTMVKLAVARLFIENQRPVQPMRNRKTNQFSQSRANHRLERKSQHELFNQSEIGRQIHSV